MFASNEQMANIVNWEGVTLGTPSSGTLVNGSFLRKNSSLKIAILSIQVNGNSADATIALNINIDGSIEKPIYGYNAYNNTPVNCTVHNNDLHIIEACALVRIYAILPLA